MDQTSNQEELEMNQPSNQEELQMDQTSNQEEADINQKSSQEQIKLEQLKEQVNAQKIKTATETISNNCNCSQSQLNWMNRQVCKLERELLLNNNNSSINNNFMSNWTKVILSALAVIIPGIGQIMGIIIGLVLVSNDINADKRSYGAALLTVSVVAFIISASFWFIFALTFGPQLYY